MADPYPSCPRCASEAFDGGVRLCTDSDAMSDTYTSWARCTRCDLRFILHVTSDVSVSMDDDAHVTNAGWICDTAEWERTQALAKRCPRPDDPECTCPAHTTPPATMAPAWYRSW